MGWTSPMSSILRDEDASPLPAAITVDEESWIGSLLPLGAIVGPFLAGFLASRIGRKWSLLVASAPLLAGWALVAAATDVALIYAGRVCWGVAVGMLFTVTPIYVAEIASDDVRGALGSFLVIFVSLGFLLVYSVGPFASYSVIAYVGVAVVAAFDIAFYFMPESPIYHLTKNNREAAAACLMQIRGQSRAAAEAELQLMADDVSAAKGKTATFTDIFKGANFKAFYISSALIAFLQLCGINAVLFYMANIFEAAGSSLEPALATIIIGAVQLGAACVCPFVVDRLGRRPLLLVSSAGTTLALVFLGMYFFLDAMDHDITQSLGFLPITALVVFMVAYSVGLGALPWAIMGELCPIEVKSIITPMVTALCWILSFLITRYFGPISDALGMHVAFWIFGACCVCAFFFTLFVVPETKGKSFAEIQDMLAGKSPMEIEYKQES